MEKEIILVDNNDEEIGWGSKEEVHRTGRLHRAFSVFLYNGTQLLIQQRADGKYHSGGLWANTCCSHPRKGEKLEAAVKRRLMEETGIECEVREIFSFVYKHKFNEKLYEHEYDHVFLGKYSGEYEINPEEIKALKWVEAEWLEKDLKENPDAYACWFKIAAPEVIRIMKLIL